MGALAFVVMLSLLGLRWGRWLVLVGAVLGALGLVVAPSVREALIKEATQLQNQAEELKKKKTAGA